MTEPVNRITVAGVEAVNQNDLAYPPFTDPLGAIEAEPPLSVPAEQVIANKKKVKKVFNIYLRMKIRLPASNQ